LSTSDSGTQTHSAANSSAETQTVALSAEDVGTQACLPACPRHLCRDPDSTHSCQCCRHTDHACCHHLQQHSVQPGGLWQLCQHSDRPYSCQQCSNTGRPA
jgi:hypothetical protein